MVPDSTSHATPDSGPDSESSGGAVHPFAGDPVFDLHLGGKMEIVSTVPLAGREDLSLAYTPGVAQVCEAIAADPDLTRHYTWVSNTVAVVTDGTAVLGLGDIGPAAAMPVMEGKAVLFKQFGGVDAVPLCLATTDVEEIIETVVRLAPSFGGINLEDISAPRCFEIEDRLKGLLDIPVFHDDQHGTAVVALAALSNALRLTGRDPEGTRVVISGAGAAGVAVARILLEAGVRDLVVLDRRGVLNSERADLTPVKRALAQDTADHFGRRGSLAEVMRGADVYLGVSGGTVPEEVVASMAPQQGKLFRVLLHLLDEETLPTDFARFTNLSLARRQEVLDGWMTSSWYAQRQAIAAVLALLSFGYTEHPKVSVVVRDLFRCGFGR